MFFSGPLVYLNETTKEPILMGLVSWGEFSHFQPWPQVAVKLNLFERWIFFSV